MRLNIPQVTPLLEQVEQVNDQDPTPQKRESLSELAKYRRQLLHRDVPAVSQVQDQAIPEERGDEGRTHDGGRACHHRHEPGAGQGAWTRTPGAGIGPRIEVVAIPGHEDPVDDGKMKDAQEDSGVG